MSNLWKVWLPLAFLLAGMAYLGLMSARNTDSRLYWEYAGRIDHRSFTQDYLEWVHHRTGALVSADAAVRADRRLSPYTDFASEYPPGALLLFAVPRLAFDGLPTYSHVYSLLAALSISLAAIAMIAVVRQTTSDHRMPAAVAFVFVVWIALTGRFIVLRFDSFVVLAIALAMLARTAGRQLIAGFCIGIGAAIKLWPAFLLPLMALTTFREPQSQSHAVRDVMLLGLGAVVGFAVPCAIVLLLGTSPADLLDYLGYYRDRPPQIESLLASLMMLQSILGVATVSIGFDFGSPNLLSSNWQGLAQALSAGFVACYLGALYSVARSGGSRDVEACAMGFVVIALILASKVFSGEYLIWMMPFALLAVARQQWAVVVAYAAALIWLRAVYSDWPSVTAVEPLGTAFVMLKNLSCVAMAALLAYEMVRASRLSLRTSVNAPASNVE